MNDMKKDENIVPVQKTGEQTGASAEVRTVSARQAKEVFDASLKRLLDINGWKQYSGVLSAEFLLTDSRGNAVNRAPEIGDLIRIDLPGPGTSVGDGYDWVRIEAFDEDHKDNFDLFAFRVRPAANPASENDEVAHFYQKLATSSFILKRKGNVVTASEEGRNEVPNAELEKMQDKLRNKLIAEAARHGFSFPQWKTLMKGILGE